MWLLPISCDADMSHSSTDESADASSLWNCSLEPEPEPEVVANVTAADAGETCWETSTITPLVLIWSAMIGVLYLSTVPLTVGLVGDMVGDKWAATLFGFAFASHQLGSFFGSWLGGRIHDQTGSYDRMWLLCAAVGLIAAIIHVPIRPVRIRVGDSAEAEAAGDGGQAGQEALVPQDGGDKKLPAVVATGAGSAVQKPASTPLAETDARP